MNYLALGNDSKPFAEAPTLFARLIGAHEFHNMCRGMYCSVEQVLADISHVRLAPDVSTLSVGQADFLALFYEEPELSKAQWMEEVETILNGISSIVHGLERLGGSLILSTVFAETMFVPEADVARFNSSSAMNRLNDGIRDIARMRKELLSDLEAIFSEPPAWNDPDAAATLANYWQSLLRA